MGAHYWRNGEATEATIEAFTEGDCWILALQLHRIAGLPVYVLGDGAHWVVKASSKWYLDVTGFSSRSQLLRRWGVSSLRPVDDELYALVSSDMVAQVGEAFPDSWRRAAVLARRLLDKHGTWS